MRKLAIIFEFLYTEINGPVSCRICISFINKSLDHVDHALDLLCSLGCSCSRFYIHICHILLALFDITGRDFLCGNALFNGLLDDLIIYIGKVGYIIYFISFIFHISAHRIKNDHRAGISDMDQIVYRRSADIHFYFSFFQRYKFLFSACQCVKNLHVTLPPISRFCTGSRSPVRRFPLPVL